MSSLAVASPARLMTVSQSHPVRIAKPGLARPCIKSWRPCALPHPPHLARPASRSMVVLLAAHRLQHVGEHLSRLHSQAIAPLQQTAPSREFTAVMLGFTAYNYRKNPTLSQALTSAGFIVWPRLMESAFAKRPLLRELGLQAFNLVIVRGNPCGVALALVACYAVHQLTPYLPKETHQGARTIAFWGALVGGARFNTLLG